MAGVFISKHLPRLTVSPALPHHPLLFIFSSFVKQEALPEKSGILDILKFILVSVSSLKDPLNAVLVCIIKSGLFHFDLATNLSIVSLRFFTSAVSIVAFDINVSSLVSLREVYIFVPL
jgi:hypothetical protein